MSPITMLSLALISTSLLSIATANDHTGLQVEDSAVQVQGEVEFVYWTTKDLRSISLARITTDTTATFEIDFKDAIAAGLQPGDRATLTLEPDDSLPASLFSNSRMKIKSVVSHVHRKSQKAQPTGELSVLFLRMNYIDVPESQCDASCITNNMFESARSIQKMYSENSYGALSFKASSTSSEPRILTVSIPRSIGDPCASISGGNLNQIVADGNAAALAAGIDFNQYHLVVHVTPAFCGIGVAIPSANRAFVNDFGADTMAHEIGHVLGAGHASLDPLNFPQNFESTIVDSTDGILEYGDIANVMGYSTLGLRGFSGVHRFAFGWIPEVAVLRPTLNQCATTISLRSLFQTPDSSGVSLVAFPGPNDMTYFISYRTPEGQDAFMEFANEVTIHTYNTRAGGSPTFLWKSVAVGETETTSDGVVLTVLSVQNGVAVITLARNGVFSSECTPSNTPSNIPTPSASPSARLAIGCGQSLSGTNVGNLNQFDLAGPDGSDTAFIFVLDSTATVTFSLCGQANFDTLLQVISQDLTTSFGFNDDAPGCGSTSRLSRTLNPGTYFAVVDGFAGEVGTFTLSVTCVAASASPTRSIPPSTTRSLSSSASPPASTPSGTPASTPSGTPVSTPSGTPVSTPSGTPANTPSGTPASTPSGTPANTPSGTPANTPSGTPANTPSGTPASTPSGSPANTPSGTPASTPSGTPANTPSGTPANTPSGTPASTPSGTPANTPSGTPANTPSGTPASTPSVSRLVITPAATSTPSPSLTPRIEYAVMTTMVSSPPGPFPSVTLDASRQFGAGSFSYSTCYSQTPGNTGCFFSNLLASGTSRCFEVLSFGTQNTFFLVHGQNDGSTAKITSFKPTQNIDDGRKHSLIILLNQNSGSTLAADFYFDGAFAGRVPISGGKGISTCVGRASVGATVLGSSTLSGTLGRMTLHRTTLTSQDITRISNECLN